MFAGLLKDGFFATKLLGRGNLGGREERAFKSTRATRIARSRKCCFIAFRMMRELLYEAIEKDLLPMLHALA